MTIPPPSAEFEPQLVLLLHGDPQDAVTKALVSGRSKLGWPVLAVSARELLDTVEFGDAWTVAGRRVEPQHTALVNRLPLDARLETGSTTVTDTAADQALWTRLRDEIGRFRYASSRPTATSIMGCCGSLLDQWEDLPRWVPELRVPDHSAPSLPRDLQGTVFTVNRWTPYSLGQPRGSAQSSALPASARLDYVKPDGLLVHLAQIGDTMFFPNPPPTMTAAQQEAMVGVARALAAVSPLRILEHAFFLGRGAPVLYSTFPVPVLSGTHPLYPDLVTQGLRHDIKKWGGRRPA